MNKFVQHRWAVRLFAVAFSTGFSWLLGLLLAPPFATTAAVIGAVCSAAAAILVERIVANYRSVIRKQNRQLAEQVSELERMNELLSDSNAELKAFAHTVAHDLKSPITAVVLNAEFLADSLAQEMGSRHLGELREAAEELVEGGHSMAGIVDDLLLLASVSQEDVAVRPFDMSTVVQGALPRLRKMLQESGAELTMPEQWPVAVGYAPWVEQVWVNYLSNACKYGGTPPIIRLGAEVRPDCARFWVRDHGPGISSADCADLFQEFTRLQPSKCDGHGLGLWIVRRIVERLGGRVGVESVIGEGSCFFFELPTSTQDSSSHLVVDLTRGLDTDDKRRSWRSPHTVN